ARLDDRAARRIRRRRAQRPAGRRDRRRRARRMRDRLAHCRDREAHAMSGRTAKRAFAARPSDVDTWVRTREAPSSRESEASVFTARLTIDVTPEQRGRIKVTAFQRGQTVADMLRALLAREFPDKDGDPQ